MDFEFSSDALMLRDMLHRFIEDEAKPLEMKYFSKGALEPAEQARLHTVIEQMGLWGITVPEKFGGGGLDLITACMLEEELGKTFLPMDIGDVPLLLYACEGDQIKNFLNPALSGERRAFLAVREPQALSPDGWKTTAVSEEQVYILNGQKLLSGMPSPKDFLIALVKVPAGISAFLIDLGQSGVQIANHGKTILTLENCRIDPAFRLGECGKALRLGAEALPAVCIRQGARYVGLASRLLEMTAAYAASWTSLGVLLKERPYIRRMLAEIKVQIESGRWLVYHAAWLADKHGPVRESAAEVRLATGDMLRRTADLMTMIYGGPAPTPEIELHRYVDSFIPMDSIEFGLEFARTVIAAEILAAVDGG